ncbi:MAG: NAD(P)H-binding protein [Propionibacteriaceae bacterium]|nr:NAD(P)H-binding protein [Propionibacteriaceae bacterium]
MSERIVILGGTGLLGQHAALSLRERGVPAVLVGLGNASLLPALSGSDIVSVNLDSASHEELISLMKGATGVIQAMGPDDRVTPLGSADAFFQKHLVGTSAKLATAARDAGVERYVICGSYFSAWSRMNPGARMAERHAYVRARRDQADQAISIGAGSMAVSVLEIPYVFGTVPGQVPMWREWLFERLRKMPVVFYPDGGSSVVTAAQVGHAAAAASLVGDHGARYPLADLQLTWKELLAMVLPALGKSPRVITVPRLLAEPTAWRMGAELAKEGREPGIDPKRLMRDIMYQRVFVDPSRAVTELGFEGGGVPEAIVATVRASYR